MALISALSASETVNTFANSIWLTILELTNNHLARQVVKLNDCKSSQAYLFRITFKIFIKRHAVDISNKKNVFCV